jgi:hypothetical protein
MQPFHSTATGFTAEPQGHESPHRPAHAERQNLLDESGERQAKLIYERFREGSSVE